ncbi:MAG: glycosyltransferase [Desulfarculales bacterium]|jgi:glycosyltransferase involved in cell wall biosynthesis|nr:glycosyltransferase [Desulfarculales bacterium]
MLVSQSVSQTGPEAVLSACEPAPGRTGAPPSFPAGGNSACSSRKNSKARQAISVVIPAHNREKTIGRAIQSVLEQTYPAQEIIVVDDGSSDNTVQAALAACPSCLIVRSSRNQGAQIARSLGIQSSQGQWIALLDSDDHWYKQKLEWQMEKARQGFQVVHGYGSVRTAQGNYEYIPLQSEGNIYPQLLRGPGPLYPTLLVHRQCFAKSGLPDPAIAAYQEWDFSLSLASHYSFGCVNKPLFVCDTREADSVFRNNYYRGLRGYEQIVCKWWPEIMTHLGPKAGMAHYRYLATQALRVSGWPGFMHYTTLGARLAGRSRAGRLLYETQRHLFSGVRRMIKRKN